MRMWGRRKIISTFRLFYAESTSLICTHRNSENWVFLQSSSFARQARLFRHHYQSISKMRLLACSPQLVSLHIVGISTDGTVLVFLYTILADQSDHLCASCPFPWGHLLRPHSLSCRSFKWRDATKTPDPVFDGSCTANTYTVAHRQLHTMEE